MGEPELNMRSKTRQMAAANLAKLVGAEDASADTVNAWTSSLSGLAAKHEELTENSTDTVYDVVDGIFTRMSTGGEADAVTAASLTPLLSALNTASRARNIFFNQKNRLLNRTSKLTPNAVQAVRVNGQSLFDSHRNGYKGHEVAGSFRLGFNGSLTVPLDAGATAADVRDALRAVVLPNINADVNITDIVVTRALFVVPVRGKVSLSPSSTNTNTNTNRGRAELICESTLTQTETCAFDRLPAGDLIRVGGNWYVSAYGDYIELIDLIELNAMTISPVHMCYGYHISYRWLLSSGVFFYRIRQYITSLAYNIINTLISTFTTTTT